MCIRDRYRKEKEKEAENAGSSKPLFTNGGPVSVSYTHLDVYKRQVYL